MVKRGRPNKLTVDGKRTIKNIIESNRLAAHRTDRTKMNEYYCRIAEDVLGHGSSDEFSFIISFVDFEAAVFKKTILTELGRLENPAKIRNMARYICENELTTKEAVAYIRQLRVGSQPAGNASDLAIVLVKAIKDYRFKHSAVEDEMIQESLNIIISENFSKNTTE
jgi:hypothetical protein